MKEKQLYRGNILWESSRMFLPEHKQALHERKKENKKVPRPIIDEQLLQQLNERVHYALMTKRKVTITYWEDGFFFKKSGTIERVHVEKQLLILRNHNEKRLIPLNYIQSVELT